MSVEPVHLRRIGSDGQPIGQTVRRIGHDTMIVSATHTGDRCARA
jgi:hypothetical protein